MSVSTDREQIERVLTRGVERIFPNKDYLLSRLSSGEKLTIYHGIDPTGPTLHIGNAVPLRKLAEFQKLGHKIILLIGDFTAMIGDPTDKSATRVALSREQVLENAKLYKEQLSKIVNFEGRNAAQIKFNSEWWSKINYAHVLEIEAQLTHSQMIKRDMFQKRMEEGKELYMHELSYPMMQGYDSVVMDVDGEIGGNDQTFNMLVGRELLKKMKDKEKFVLAVKLLVDPTGKKMGKTEGNMVAFTDTPEEAFGKIMSWPDSLMPLAYELCTDLDMKESDPKQAKLSLAREIITQYWGENEAKAAQTAWENTFSKGGVPEDILEARVMSGTLLVDALLQNKIVESKSDFRRLVKEKAINLDGAKIESDKEECKNGVYRIGKHRFIKIIVS